MGGCISLGKAFSFCVPEDEFMASALGAYCLDYVVFPSSGLTVSGLEGHFLDYDFKVTHALLQLNVIQSWSLSFTGCLPADIGVHHRSATRSILQMSPNLGIIRITE